MPVSTKAIVIGAGFGGLSVACYLARSGFEVTILEKNASPGGRAMVMQKDGFTFNMGPSWYLMPDVFEEFFADFDRLPSDYYDLSQLDPSYKIFTEKKEFLVTTAPHVFRLFENAQPGSSDQLEKLLSKTKAEYELVRAGILNKPMLSPLELFNKSTLKLLLKPNLLRSYHSRIAKYISDPDLQKILEFLVVFMGGSPKNIPALYTLLTHVDMGLGVWYPTGGMGSVVKGMVELAHELGVTFRYSHEVTRIVTRFQKVVGVETPHGVINCDVLVADADYQHVETKLLDSRQRSYDEKYWSKKVLSPSALLGYIGVSKKLPALEHHNLFFYSDWDKHFDNIFRKKAWSDEPMFYVCAPSKTDAGVAPEGMENLFILAPQPAGEQPDEARLEATMDAIIKRIEHKLGTNFSSNIVVRDIRAQNYFKSTFNASQGNAFGLSHTLRQSAFLRPAVRSKSISGLYFVGQNTNPGTGVPIAVLSGKVVGKLIERSWPKK